MKEQLIVGRKQNCLCEFLGPERFGRHSTVAENVVALEQVHDGLGSVAEDEHRHHTGQQGHHGAVPAQ